MNIRLSAGAAEAIHRLEEAGFEAYVVGGCVRDCLMGKTPHDYDITTSAVPDETITAFSGASFDKEPKIIETGLKHGTVTVILNDEQVEITTFRTESGYSDFRRPDRVDFSDKLEDDLSRRDFTINAMAYSPKTGLFDTFGGVSDLEDRIIRAVGSPAERFREDPLRILRALRFAARLGFTIESDTDKECRANAGLLGLVAGERIYTELRGLFEGRYSGQVLADHIEIIDVIMPGAAKNEDLTRRLMQMDFSQYEQPWIQGFAALITGQDDKSDNNASVGAIINRPSAPCKFHNVKKPIQAVEEIHSRLKLDAYTYDTLRFLAENQRRIIPDEDQFILRRLSQWGEDRLRQLLILQDNISSLDRMENLIKSGKCYSLKQMQVSGGDLIKIGIPSGKQIGLVLKSLLRGITDGKLANDRDALLEKAREITKG